MTAVMCTPDHRKGMILKLSRGLHREKGVQSAGEGPRGQIGLTTDIAHGDMGATPNKGRQLPISVVCVLARTIMVMGAVNYLRGQLPIVVYRGRLSLPARGLARLAREVVLVSQ